MTKAQLAALYAPVSGKPRTVGVQTSRWRKSSKRGWMDANGTWHTNTVRAELKGSFVGKVGTVRRSSKGATYRMPNGSRRYETLWEGTAIAYQA